MTYSDRWRERIVQANRREYGEDYDRLQWAGGEELARAAAERAELLAFLEDRTQQGCKGTKLDCADLSPGCRACVAGEWSCLFINGRCNCRCFYCPAEQRDDGPPMTNTVEFPRAADYADYLETFGYRGVSISGGEPFLAFDRSLAYITAVKRRFGDGVHIWLYTNGVLATGEKLRKLADAGLGEIRFDVGATGYDLEKAGLAAGIVPCVTVEIPAVPEDLDLLKRKIVEMRDRGVQYLNLHQLRLTPHNLPHLVQRGYMFLHGENASVLDSELTALRLLRYAIEEKIGLPVNYCSSVYKRRFQQAAARRRSARFVMKEYENITDSGYIRSLALLGEAADVSRQAELFGEAAREAGLWRVGDGGARLDFAADLWDRIDFRRLRLRVGYAEALIRQNVSYRNYFKEIRLNPDRKLAVEKKRPGTEFELTPEEIPPFEKLLLGGEEALPDRLAEILPFEKILPGLQEYF